MFFSAISAVRLTCICLRIGWDVIILLEIFRRLTVFLLTLKVSQQNYCRSLNSLLVV